MKALVLQENFKKAVSVVSKGISPKTHLPVLSNILIDAKKGQLTLSATNLETTISYWVGAQIEEEGSVTVPARFLQELVSTFRQEKIELTSNKTQIKLVCGDSEATLSGIDAAEFPPLPQVSEKTDVHFEKELLSKSLPFVLISASHDEGRPLLTGVYFIHREEKLLLVATDGFRLSIKELPKQTSISEGFVVSAKTLSEVFRLASEEPSKTLGIVFSKDKNQIMFILENAHIATRLIEGEYPPFTKIIPNSFTTKVVIDRESFAQGVKFAAVYAKESANLIKIKIGGDELVVSANSPQIGENKTTVKATIEGEGGEIAFNSRFLLDILSVFPDDEVILEMTGALAPGVFKAPNDPSYLHIIMPVRVQS